MSNRRKVQQFKFKKPIKLYGITDAHIGSKHFDKEKFYKLIKMIKKDPNAYCFFNGDNFEYIPPGYGISQEGQEDTPSEQLDKFIELIKSLGKKVLFFRFGNHEDRIWKLAEIDIAKRITKETGIPSLGMGMEEVHIYIKNQKYRLVSTHGVGGMSRKMFMNMQKAFPGADVYFTGHTHDKSVDASFYRIDTGSGYEEMSPFYNIVGGSFLQWADYARERNVVPKQTGCFNINFSVSGLKVQEAVI